jgi:phosphate starvation-inducible PhoH-like protein
MAARAQYLTLLRCSHKSLVLATGKAGTGKTHLAVAEGASALIRGEVQRLVLARPAVQAGEELGFLPGTKESKLGPFMQPMMDVLNTVLSKRDIESLRADNRLEFAPLAFMRGRTFTNAWVVLDEAQNTTPQQMKMALTRVGKGTKMVVTGDLEQCDLSGVSGMADFVERLRDSPQPSIGHVVFSSKDIMRSQVVEEILQVYDRDD